MLNIQRKICNTIYSWGWLFLAVVALLLCLDIEFKVVLFSCNSIETEQATNRIVLAILYSYIAAAIFHYIVNILPFIRRKKSITPFIRSQLWSIKEKLRLCKQVVLPVFDFDNKKYTKEEYSNIFSNFNLYECSIFDKKKTKLDELKELRLIIIGGVNVILAYREYIGDDLFNFLNEVLDSEFVSNGIDPFPDIEGDIRYDYNSNQQIVGECIYDLNEKVKKVIDKQNRNDETF